MTENDQPKLKPNNKLYLLLGALSAYGLILRYQAFASRNLWVDELEQLGGLHHSLRFMLVTLLKGWPGAFPGDYLLTWPLAQLTNNKWVLTSPHIISTLLGIYLFFLICREDISSMFGLLTAFTLFVFNQTLIFHAFEIRPYAVLPTLALAIYWYSKSYIQSQSFILYQKAVFGLLLWVGILFHPYGLLMNFVFVNYHLLFSRRNSSFRQTLKSLAAPALWASVLAFPFWLYYAIPNFAMHYGVDPFQYSGKTINSLVRFVFGTLCGSKIRYVNVLCLLLMLSSLFVPDEKRKCRLALLCFVILTPVVLIFISDVRGAYWFIQRQFIWLMPFYALLVGMSFSALLESCLYKTTIAAQRARPNE